MGVAVSSQADRSRFYEVADDVGTADIEPLTVAFQDPKQSIKVNEKLCNINPQSLEFTAVPFLRIRERENGTCWNIPLDCFNGKLLGDADIGGNARRGQMRSPLTSDGSGISDEETPPSPSQRQKHHVDWSAKKVLPPITPSSSCASFSSAEFLEDEEGSMQMSETISEKLQQTMQQEMQRNDGERTQRVRQQRKTVKERSAKRSIGQFSMQRPESPEPQRNMKLPPLRSTAAEDIFSESMNFSDSVVQQSFFPDEANGGFSQAFSTNEMSREFSRTMNRGFSTSSHGRLDGPAPNSRPSSGESLEGRRDSGERPRRLKKPSRDKGKKSKKLQETPAIFDEASLPTTAFANMFPNDGGNVRDTQRRSIDSAMGSFFGGASGMDDRSPMTRQGSKPTFSSRSPFGDSSAMRRSDSMMGNFGIMGGPMDDRGTQRSAHLVPSFEVGNAMEPRPSRQSGMFRSPMGHMGDFPSSFGLQKWPFPRN